MNKQYKKRLSMTIASVLAILGFTMPAIALADLNGIDVSSYQPSDITARVAADFAIVKTTQGTSYVNPKANAQIANAQATGKEIGIYHYAGGGNPESEADYFINNSANYIRKAVLVLDWESNQNASWGNTDWATRFVNRVKARTGVIPMVYVQASAVWQVQGARNAGAGLWVAQYASMSPTGYQSNPWKYGAYSEAMRQYTSNGVLPGYSGRLDLNIFAGDRTAWRKYANPSGSTATVPTPAPTPKPSGIDYNNLATRTLRGEFGNLPQRRTNLDTAYGSGTYDKVQAIINSRYNVSGSTNQNGGNYSGISHRVQRGETISSIAARYGKYPLSAWKVPSGNINRIYVGQVVTYGGGSYSTSSNSSSRRVTVRSGDTLSKIASRLGVSYTQIHGYRSGNPNVIYPGEVLYY